MDKIKFMATIDTRMSEEEGLSIWSKIRHGKEVNMTVLTDKVLIYGDTTCCVFTNVLCQLKKYEIQLNID